MATRDLLALAQQVEDLISDPRSLPVSTGDAELDSSVVDFRESWISDETLSVKSLRFWN